MSAKIGDWEFDSVAYDDESDVLYLNLGGPRPTTGKHTPEGHILLFDRDSDEFCGVTIIGYRHLREREGDVNVTVPRREQLEVEDRDLGLTTA